MEQRTRGARRLCSWPRRPLVNHDDPYCETTFRFSGYAQRLMSQQLPHGSANDRRARRRRHGSGAAVQFGVGKRERCSLTPPAGGETACRCLHSTTRNSAPQFGTSFKQDDPAVGVQAHSSRFVKSCILAFSALNLSQWLWMDAALVQSLAA